VSPYCILHVFRISIVASICKFGNDMVGMLLILRVADSLFWARAIHSIVLVSPMLVTISRSIVMDLTSSIIVFVRGCFWAFH
jgi:hypothetical protein